MELSVICSAVFTAVTHDSFYSDVDEMIGPPTLQFTSMAGRNQSILAALLSLKADICILSVTLARIEAVLLNSSATNVSLIKFLLLIGCVDLSSAQMLGLLSFWGITYCMFTF